MRAGTHLFEKALQGRCLIAKRVLLVQQYLGELTDLLCLHHGSPGGQRPELRVDTKRLVAGVEQHYLFVQRFDLVLKRLRQFGGLDLFAQRPLAGNTRLGGSNEGLLQGEDLWRREQVAE